MTGSPRSPHPPPRARILASMRQWGPSTTAQLAERLGMKPQTVRSVLRRLKRRGEVRAEDESRNPKTWEVKG